MAEHRPQIDDSTASHLAQLTHNAHQAFNKIINGSWSVSDQGRTFVLPFSSEKAKFAATSHRLTNDSDFDISVREDLTTTLAHMLAELSAVRDTLESLQGGGFIRGLFSTMRAYDIHKRTQRLRSPNDELEVKVEEYTPAVAFVYQPLPNSQRAPSITARAAPTPPIVRLGAAMPRASAPSARIPATTDFRVAWICPVERLELLPLRLMFDTEFEQSPSYDADDDNVYYCGTMAGHNVVMATCPAGMTGNVNAGHLATYLFRTFSRIRMTLLVGIGGGVPLPIASRDTLDNVHVGDVVVGWPGDGKPACVYYESGRLHPNSFEHMGTFDRPDRVLLNALGKVASDHEMARSTFQQHILRLEKSPLGARFMHPGREYDRLYRADYPHQGSYGSGCVDCRHAYAIVHPPRTEAHEKEFVFHRGRIATGNSVVQHGIRRDEINELCGGGVLCIKMEAAGVDASRKCLVIRGISDYADSHKDDTWRSHAAGRAAVFAKELLSKVPVGAVKEMGGLD